MNKGDKVIVVYEDKRIPPSEATIVSVGRKYITINNIHPDYSKFDLTTYESVDTKAGYNIRAKLYSSLDEYRQEKEQALQYQQLYNKLLCRLKELTLEQLMAIDRYLSE